MFLSCNKLSVSSCPILALRKGGAEWRPQVWFTLVHFHPILQALIPMAWYSYILLGFSTSFKTHITPTTVETNQMKDLQPHPLTKSICCCFPRVSGCLICVAWFVCGRVGKYCLTKGVLIISTNRGSVFIATLLMKSFPKARKKITKPLLPACLKRILICLGNYHPQEMFIECPHQGSVRLWKQALGQERVSTESGLRRSGFQVLSAIYQLWPWRRTVISYWTSEIYQAFDIHF